MTFSTELIAGVLSFLFTLMVLSYLVADNPLFRLAVYLFVGVSAGYAAAIAWHQVVLPKLFVPLLEGGVVERLILFIPLVLSALMLTKISPRLAALGSPAMAFLVGVGAAVAVGGAVLGTLFPQISASVNLFDLQQAASIGVSPAERLVEGVIVLVGTLSTLVYFHFGARAAAGGTGRRNFLIRMTALLGQGFIAITFGVLFAGAYAAALTALIERLNSIVQFFTLL